MLVIFDLDGTLTPQRPSSTAAFEWVLLPGVRARCVELAAAGHILTVASNQGGLKKGLGHQQVIDMLEWLVGELGIVAYRYASGYAPRRKKPAPGMLNELMTQLGYDPVNTVFVGDSESDYQAAQAAGCGFAWAREFFGGREEG